MITLDHIAISGNTLEEATDFVSSRLGVKLQDGGCHDYFGTHNRLLRLSNGIYLEAIAINPRAKKITFPRWFNLDNFTGNPRITNWICRSEDLYSEVKRLSFSRTKIIQIKRGELEWHMALPEDGLLPFDGAFPAILKWTTDPPLKKLIPSGCSLKHMTIFHPKAVKLQEKLKNFKDPRISFETHVDTKFFAEFNTPHGPRCIE